MAEVINTFLKMCQLWSKAIRGQDVTEPCSTGPVHPADFVQTKKLITIEPIALIAVGFLFFLRSVIRDT
jgi:hypothetical protein